jgi:hypothetical protein
MSIEEMIVRLATRGLLPCEHNLTIWHTIDGKWGVAIQDAYEKENVQALKGSLKEALEDLIIQTNMK